MTHLVRLDQAKRLASQLGAQLAVDRSPAGPQGAVRTAAMAWGQVAPHATHHLVIQDDVLLRPEFIDNVTDAVRSRPEVMWNFYSNWNSRAAAVMRIGALWGCTSFEPPRDEYASTLAAVLPRAHAIAFADRLRLAAAKGLPEEDNLLRQYLNEVRLPLWQTIPNLVEHSDGASLAGNEKVGRRKSAYFDADATFKADGPALGFAEIPYYPWLLAGRRARLFYTAGVFADARPLEDALQSLGLTHSAVLAQYERDRRTVTERYRDADAEPVIQAYGWELWLAGITYGVLASLTGQTSQASDRIQKELWSTLINGSAFQRTEPPQPWVIDCLADLVSLAFAARPAHDGGGLAPMTPPTLRGGLLLRQAPVFSNFADHQISNGWETTHG